MVCLGGALPCHHQKNLHNEVMSDKPIKLTFGGALLALLALAIFLVVAWEIYSGVAYHRKGEPSLRALDPGVFWFEIAAQSGLATVIALWARRVVRSR
jgi:hypothetical protein